MQEIERKYLLKDSIISLIDHYSLKAHTITQFYTTITPEKGVRYRKMDERYFKTVKYGTGAVREEIEAEISKQRYRKKWKKRIKNPIQKKRYMFYFEGREYEIDVFKGANKGLYLLESEFDTIEAFEAFRLPAVLQVHTLKDVSFDESYKNKNMVLYGKPQESYDINAIFAELTTKNSDELDAYFTPNLSPIDTLRVILYKFALLILFYKERLVLSDEEEDLHQFRIGIRKSRAFLKEFDFLLPDSYRNTLSKNLADFARQTNHKRDLDVMQVHLTSLLNGQYDEIQAHILQKQKQEQKHIQTMLKGEVFEQFFTTYLDILKNETLLDANNNTGSMERVLRKVLKKLHQRIIKKITLLEKEFSVEKLHKIRITLKKLRYLLEEFQQILGIKEVEEIIKKGKTLQTLLGDFNDSITQEDLLHDYLQEDLLKDTLSEHSNQDQKETLAHIMKKLHLFKKEDFIL